MKENLYIILEKIYNNNYELQKLIDNTINYISNNQDLNEIVDEIKLFISMLSDYKEGKYKGLSEESRYLMVGCLIYLISPIDLVPDFLFLGKLDDAMVVLYTVKKISKEIEKYKKWKSESYNTIFQTE